MAVMSVSKDYSNNRHYSALENTKYALINIGDGVKNFFNSYTVKKVLSVVAKVAAVAVPMILALVIGSPALVFIGMGAAIALQMSSQSSSSRVRHYED